MPLLEQDLIYHLELLCPTPVLMGFLLLERKYVMVVMQLSVSIVECLSLD
jgi:hypothetical protein